eukprot:s2417_g17.t15
MELRPTAVAAPSGEATSSRVPARQANPKAFKLLARLLDPKVSNEEAVALLPKLLRRKVLRNTKEVTVAIGALSKRTLYQEAGEFALAACRWRPDDQRSRAPEPNVAVCGAALAAARRSPCGWVLALQLLECARKASVQLDAAGSDAAFMALASAPPDDAWRLMADHTTSREPGITALTFASAHFGRLQQWQRAVDLILSSRCADTTAFEVLVAAAADAGEWAVALALTETMEVRLGFASGGALATAAAATEISLPHLFKACRTRASCHSTQFHAVFQGSARKMGCSGSKAATKKAVAAPVDKQEEAPTAAPAAVDAEEQRCVFLSVFEEPMPSAHAEGTEEAAEEAPAVTVAEEVRAGLDAEAHDIVLPMVQVTASDPPNSFCACGSLWCPLHRQVHFAAKGTEVQQALLQRALKTGGIHEAALVRLATPQPADNSSWQWALQLMAEISGYGLEVPSILWKTAIGVCASQGLWQQAIRILNTMREGSCLPDPDIVCFNSALNACERAARPEPAAELLRDMLRCRASPDSTSFARVAGAYSRQTGWEMALALCSATWHGLQPDEDAGSQGLDATAFLAASGAVEVLFAAAVVRGICAHRRMLCAEAVRAFKKFLNTVGNDRFLTLAERNAMHEKLTQLRLRMARTYARVLAAMCLVFVLSIQRNLILGGLRWMTAPFAWLVLGIFALLVVIQLHPSILSAATLNFWYVVGTTVVAIGYWPAFLPAEHLSTVSVVALVLYRLPSAMVAPQLALIVVGNLTLPCVVFARTIIEAYEFNRRGLGVSFTIHVEVTCSLMAITVSVILRSALRHIAEQYVRSTKAATELNAASALLQLTCDAVVELDADLRISTENSQELAGILLRSNSGSNLAGVSFTDFVTAAEKDRAAEVLNSRLPHATGGLDPEVQTVSAQAFHTRLVDSCSSKFRTEVFQVSYRKLDGGICHLIGLRDFTDQSCLAGQAVDAIEDPMTSASASQSWAPSSSDSMRSSPFDIEEGLPGQQFPQPPEKARSRWVLLELDIPSMQIYGASAPIGWLAGRQLANIFPEDVTDGFQKLWNDILAVEERGELDRTVLSFSNIEMRFSPKKMALISGTVEIILVPTATACGAAGRLKEAELEGAFQPWQRAEELLWTAQQTSTRLGAAAHSSLTSSLDKGLEWARALQALQVSRFDGLPASMRSYGSALNGLNSAAASAAAWGLALILLEDMQAASIETSNIALQAAIEVFNEGAPLPSWLLELLTTSLVAEEPSVVATASYKLQLHGRLDAHSAAVLERKVLRGCWIRFRELRQREVPGPTPDTVLQQQPSLGAGITELLSKATFLGRLAVRRLHRMEGTFDASSSLAAKSVPAWVESQLSLQLPSSSSAGRIVGHRGGTLDVWQPILADHDRSQHAERQALLLLLGDLDTDATGLSPPAGGIRLRPVQQYVSAHPCISCTAVFFQLASSWRGVRLQVAFDAWEETKRWTASLAPEEEGELQQRLHSLERAPD